MKARPILSLLTIGLGSLMNTSKAEAEEVIFGFTGRVTSVIDQNDFLGGQVGFGATLDGQYTFDPLTPDVRPTDPSRGQYDDAINSIGGSLGALTFSGPTPSQNFIRAVNDFLTPPVDSYRAFSHVEILGEELSLLLFLIDDDATAFDSDVLPLVPPSLFPFNIRRFELLSEELGVQVQGDITSLMLIPEPATLLIMVVGATSLFRRKALPRLE